MPNEVIQSTVQKNSSPSSILKVLVLTRKDLYRRYASLPITNLEMRHVDCSLHPDWFYSEVVLFVDDHLSKIFKAPIRTNDYIYTDDVRQLFNI